MLTDNEIERRKPLWKAFSDFWLDNQLQDFEYERAADLMISSGYPLKELEKIFTEEVAPVVYSNLLSMTGEWAGFDEKWLCRKIVENIKKTESNFFYRKWIQSSAGKFLMTKMAQEEWEILLKTYKKKLEKS